jgi:hypothetical protein
MWSCPCAACATSDKVEYVAHGPALLNEIRMWCCVGLSSTTLLSDNPRFIGNGHCAPALARCAAFCVSSDATGQEAPLSLSALDLLKQRTDALLLGG